MEYVFEKYRVNGKDYLMFDTNKYDYELSNDKIRRICNHHFGMGISAVILGPYFHGDGIGAKLYDKEGKEESFDTDSVAVFNQCLKDHIYIKDEEYQLVTSGGVIQVEDLNQDQLHKVKQTGKIITADHFIEWL